jgi:2-iminobutanoate/2-iminopropanoate deaminase
MSPLHYVTEAAGVPVSNLPYSPAVVAGDWCYASGQVALGADGTLDAGDIAHETTIAMHNLLAVLAAAQFGASDVVMVTALLADIADFATFNETYSREWPSTPYPARMAYQAAALPLGARVELQAVARRAQ